MKIKLNIIVVLFATLLLGCSNTNEELTTFENNMNAFYENIVATGEKINNIDVNSDQAITELINTLEEMKYHFNTLATINIPKEYNSIEQLILDAGSYMNESITLYTTAYNSEVFDETIADSASKYYTRAMERINYISQVLQGYDVEVFKEPTSE
ncbi:MAG: hypothetical protein ACRC7V_01270 [Lachnospiraceae bacterium]